ncbi:MAG: RAD55 family ATPase [Candidatus Thermoplasmatota archaeon]
METKDIADARTRLCNELTSIILKENKDVIVWSHLIAGLRKFECSFPLLHSISIRGDFTVEAGAPYSKELANTYYAIIDSAKDFLQIMVGHKEAEERISGAAEKFLSSHLQDILSTGLYEDFPGLFRLDRTVSYLEELKGKEEIDQIVAIFEEIFNAVLKSSFEADLQRLKEILTTAKFEGDQLSLSIDAENNVRLIINSGLSPTLVPNLSRLLDDMLGVATGITEEAAFGILHTVLSRYGELPDDLKITNHLMGGAFAKKIAIGIPALDNALKGGIPRGHSILLDGPSGIEKDMIAYRFADEGLTSGTALLIALSTEPPKEFLAGLSFFSTPASGEGRPEMLQIVDWHTCLHSNVEGVEVHGNVLMASKDLTNVGVAIDRALKKLPQTPARRAVIKLIPSALRIFGFDTTYEFLQMLRAKLRRNDITTIFLLEGGACEERTLQVLYDSFDGVIEIRRWMENGRILREIGIHSMMGTLFDERRHQMELADEGLWLTSLEAHEVPSLIPLPVSAKERLHNFIEGFERICSLVPKTHAILLQGPSSDEKERIGYQFLEEGLRSGEPILVLLSQTTCGEFQSQMKTLGIEIQSDLNKGAWAIVDWYSFRVEMIEGVQDEGDVVKSSSDLTALAIAVERAISKLPENKPKRALIDLLSPASQFHELSEICDLAMAMKVKLTSANFTSLFLLNEDMHDSKALSMIQPLFDGVIAISKVKLREEVRTGIGIISMRGSPFSSTYHNLIAQEDRMTVGDMVDEEVPALEAKEQQKSDRETILEGKVKALAREIIAMKRTEAEVRRILSVLDDLLEDLPDDVIAEFARSKEYVLYEKILDRYRVK